MFTRDWALCGSSCELIPTGECRSLADFNWMNCVLVSKSHYEVLGFVASMFWGFQWPVFSENSHRCTVLIGLDCVPWKLEQQISLLWELHRREVGSYEIHVCSGSADTCVVRCIYVDLNVMNLISVCELVLKFIIHLPLSVQNGWGDECTIHALRCRSPCVFNSWDCVVGKNICEVLVFWCDFVDASSCLCFWEKVTGHYL